MADVKLSALPAVTSLSAGDLFPVTINLAGTPVSKNITRENLAAEIRALIVAAAISDGDTTHAPDGNSVFDALALKAPLDSPSFVTPALGTPASGNLVNCTGYPAPLPTGYLSGLGMSHATDTDHDITIAAGKARDSIDAVDMVLSSAITKRFDATWAVGTNAGGMALGESLPTSGTIHLWLIKRSDTGVVDVMANNHATSGLSPTLPSGYDYKRLIGSYRTDASSNIINGAWWGTGLLRTFMFSAPILDVNATNSGTSAVTAALSVPSGIVVFAHIVNAGLYSINYVSALNSTDLPPSASAAPLGNNGSIVVSSQGGNSMRVATNTSAQIRYRVYATGAGEAIRIATYGWDQCL